jgi:Chaperone of endosialidase
VPRRFCSVACWYSDARQSGAGLAPVTEVLQRFDLALKSDFCQTSRHENANPNDSHHTHIPLFGSYRAKSTSGQSTTGWRLSRRQYRAEGQSALLSLTSGTYNTAVGLFSLITDAEGGFNTAIGAGALLANAADGNTATGAGALLSNATGFNNTAIGVGSLNANSTGNSNTAIGQNAGNGITTGNNVIAIGASGANVNNSCFIGHVRGVQTSIGDAVPVLIDSAGQLGTLSSSRRFKTDIKPMDNVSEAVLALKPVKFHYKSDKTNTPQFGLIAEEVAELNPDLIVRDKDGEVYTVRYDQINAMLLNEFLKAHRKDEKLEATITRQEEQIEALAAGLQKVSARIEMKEPTAQIADNQ